MTFLSGWTGRMGEDAWICETCGFRVSEPTGPRCREAKREHRLTCKLVTALNEIAAELPRREVEIPSDAVKFIQGVARDALKEFGSK